MKADVQRSAPDSNPYLTVHWLRSLIASIARRLFDFYLDLRRTERRLFPDTADDETALQWGDIYVGPKNPASTSSGTLVATGTVGGTIGIGATLTAGGIDYITTTADTISLLALSVVSITRVATVATVTTDVDHNLAPAVPVTIAGADQAEYNVTDAEITVTGLNTFTYEVTGAPTTPATGTITASFTTATVDVDSIDFGAGTNLDAGTPVTLQSPIVDVDDTLFVTFGAVGGGTDEEATPAYKDRYLDKIRNPVAHFNEADIAATAKEVPGVTRVFVEAAGTSIGTVVALTVTRNANVATVTTAAPHGFEGGQTTTVNGADQVEYNVTDERIIVESTTVFHYVVFGSPTTPATGAITAATRVPLGQVRVFFMRDNDPDPIPTAGEVQDVVDQLDTIRPANTGAADLIVAAPVAVPVTYAFSLLVPNTPTMRDAIEASLAQFHAEETSVGQNVAEAQYRAAIQNTVDPDTGDTVTNFSLTTPTGDVVVGSGEIATLGSVSF